MTIIGCNAKPGVWLSVLAILLLPDLLWLLLSDEPLYALQHGLIFTFCLLLGGLIWSHRRAGILLVIGLPFALLVPLECYYIWRYSFPSSAHVLAIVSETTLNEATEFLGYPVIAALLLADLLIVSAFVLAWQKIGRQKLFPDHRAWRWVGVAMLLPFVSLASTEFALNKKGQRDASINQDPNQDQSSEVISGLLKDVRFGMDEVITSSFPFGVPFRISTYLSEQRRLNEARIKAKQILVAATTPPVHQPISWCW